MKSQQPTLSQALIDEVTEQVKRGTPDLIIESLASQVFLAREARDRVLAEGSVVRDPKGSVIAHPAIKIEADSVRVIEAMLSKWAKR